MSAASRRRPPPSSPSRCPGSRDPGRWAPALLLAAALLPCAASAATLSVEGGRVVLGRSPSVAVTIRVDQAPDAPPASLHLAVNVGSFSEPERVGPGAWRARYTPPPTRFPQLALVAVWREGDPPERLEVARLPLSGTTRLPVAAPRGLAVLARVGDEVFGPLTAGPTGQVAIPVVVPPSARHATVTVAGGAAPVVKTVALASPPYPRLTAAAVTGALVADGLAPAFLEVVHEPGIPSAAVRVATTHGPAERVASAPGRATFRAVPPAVPGAQELRWSVTVEGDPPSKATARAVLLPREDPSPPEATSAASWSPAADGAPSAAPPTAGAAAEERGVAQPASAPGPAGAAPAPAAPAAPRGGFPRPPTTLAALAAPSGPSPLREPGAARAPSAASPSPRPAAAAAGVPGPGGAEGGAEATRRFYLGARLGFANGLGGESGLRRGLDVWTPLRFGSVRMSAALAVTEGSASRAELGPDGSIARAYHMSYAPVSARAVFELVSGSRFAAGAGVALAAVYARVFDAGRPSSAALGAGALGLAACTFAVGPGHLFAEASLGFLPVGTPAYRVDAGGLGLEAGYRIPLF